jgi:hypothetical protein
MTMLKTDRQTAPIKKLAANMIKTVIRSRCQKAIVTSRCLWVQLRTRDVRKDTCKKTSGDLEIFAGMTAVVLWTHITKWVGNTNESP